MKCKSKREAYADLRKKKLAMDNARKAMYNSGGVHPRINIAFNKACWEWEDERALLKQPCECGANKGTPDPRSGAIRGGWYGY